MTDFFTHCWRKPQPDNSAQARRATTGAAWIAGFARWLAAATLALALPLGALAETAAEVAQLRLERNSDGISLFANVKIDLPAAVEDALQKGVPMFFVAEADVVRHRWYWTDKKVTSIQRHMRLAYQPLTRRWRLNVASGAITANSVGVALNLNFDSLADAMAALQRLSGWKIAEASALEPDASYRVEFRFGLDLAQLPRPFQIGVFGQSDWTISASATQQVGPENGK